MIPWVKNKGSNERFSANLNLHQVNLNLYQVPLYLYCTSLFSTAPPGAILIQFRFKFVVSKLWQLVVICTCQILPLGLRIVVNFPPRQYSDSPESRFSTPARSTHSTMLPNTAHFATIDTYSTQQLTHTKLKSMCQLLPKLKSTPHPPPSTLHLLHPPPHTWHPTPYILHPNHCEVFGCRVIRVYDVGCRGFCSLGTYSLFWSV